MRGHWLAGAIAQNAVAAALAADARGRISDRAQLHRCGHSETSAPAQARSRNPPPRSGDWPAADAPANDLKHHNPQWQGRGRPAIEPLPSVVMTSANASAPKEVVAAALLVIGNEILSGRTKDKNIGYIAEYLTALGIDLEEVRVVGDEEAMIVEAVNTLRDRYTYVFTTGGIGPTHDDITADCVAKAFGVSIDID